MDIGTYIKNAREKRNFSQRQLALYAGISNATISRIEKNIINPDPGTLIKIAEALKVDKNILFELCEYVDPQEKTQKDTLKEELSGVQFALYGEAHDLTEDEMEDILNFIRFKKSQRK